MRPRRSVLYMPGSNQRALEKAKSLAADALILDLEDAVAPDAKETARGLVCAEVQARGYGPREVVVRVNDVSGPWGEADLKAVAEAGPHAVLVPKVQSADDVSRLSGMLNGLGAPEGMALWAMMETPAAILHAEAIAATAEDTRLRAFVMGTNDLAKELRCALTPGRAPLMTALSIPLLAARAHGLAIIDGVFNNIQDTDGFIQECRQGADFGFDGKTLIHPTQIEPCNRIFAPDPDEVAFARRVIAAFDEPENAGKGVLKVDGRMVERLHAEQGRRLVAMADAIASREGPS
ncbi:MAG: HpcH/HpaI aldolase/citrate lyase family protein [Alphaproteobacteria bacterium]